MFVSIAFSAVIYRVLTHEIERFERGQRFLIERRLNTQSRNFREHIPLNPELMKETKQRILFILIGINTGILAISGGLGYLLAGRTLKPIKKMVDEQKRFIADSSHEFRTPLTSLRSEIEVGLRNSKLTIHDAKKLLNSNLEEVVSLQKLSDNLLELAQNGNMIKPQDMENISILEIAKTAIKKIESLARKKQITIENKIEDIKIKGIEDRLIEVFVILLDNAVKYSPRKSKVNIKSEIENGFVKISVIDFGIGIEKEDLPYIFDRFYRADKSRSQTSGYGLGLSIAKKIIESHEGSITIESKPGKQTSFTLSFPL